MGQLTWTKLMESQIILIKPSKILHGERPLSLNGLLCFCVSPQTGLFFPIETLKLFWNIFVKSIPELVWQIWMVLFKFFIPTVTVRPSSHFQPLKKNMYTLIESYKIHLLDKVLTVLSPPTFLLLISSFICLPQIPP